MLLLIICEEIDHLLAPAEGVYIPLCVVICTISRLIQEIKEHRLVLDKVGLQHEKLPKSVNVLFSDSNSPVAVNYHEFKEVEKQLQRFFMASLAFKNVVLDVFRSLQILFDQILERILDILIIKSNVFQHNVNKANLLLKVLKRLLLRQLDILLRVVIHEVRVNSFNDTHKHLNACEQRLTGLQIVQHLQKVVHTDVLCALLFEYFFH